MQGVKMAFNFFAYNQFFRPWLINYFGNLSLSSGYIFYWPNILLRRLTASSNSILTFPDCFLKHKRVYPFLHRQERRQIPGTDFYQVGVPAYVVSMDPNTFGLWLLLKPDQNFLISWQQQKTTCKINCKWLIFCCPGCPYLPVTGLSIWFCTVKPGISNPAGQVHPLWN